ncbi:MAG TPA: SPOR domain-containing protein [Blastocatellia bacterium]|nr:SPOR domain-containing protein [Blastocatellia bacterium]
MERVKITSPQVCVALAALFLCLCPLTANAQARRINGYAVQVAALTSQRSADELVRGLSVRGMNAYRIGGMSYGMRKTSALHRVRIGNFPTIASASAYAEKLLGAGLLASYAIAAYEPPNKVGSNPSWKLPTFAQKNSKRRFMPEVIDVVAAIGSRGWLLLSSESINLTALSGNSAISRELIELITYIGSRGWGLNNNFVKFLWAAAPINIAKLPSAIIADTPTTPPPPSASSSALNAAAPEIGRRELAPSVPTASPGLRSRGYSPPTDLQGAIEMRGGRMFMTLRNADPDRVFSGVARVSLTEEQRQQDVTPVSVTLLPDKEVAFPLDDATLTNGDWILMVYDLNGAARLIRGASLAPPKAPAQAPGASNIAEAVPGPEVPPAYVTGVYDATSWTQPQVSPQVQNIEGQDVVVTAPATPAVQDSATNYSAGAPNTTPQIENSPGQVVAALRQIAVTSENVTLELEIAAQNPLKNVTVTLRAGDFQDVRQAFIPTNQGRVPFLVPVAFASTGLFYEVRDEAQRVLTSGTSSLGK